uniref:28 kDa Metastriate family member n=1 Tax=Rhipicephalus appendiculatus TaxID=34631 RepID=A0A131YU87_RHIAP
MERVYFLLVLCTVFYAAPSSAKEHQGYMKLGENITVKAHVYYDHTFNNSSWRKKVITMESHFETIFKQIQENIHKMGAMINISVENVTYNNSFVVLNDSYINGTLTFESFLQFAQTMNFSRDSISYYFVGGEIDEFKKPTDELRTNKTFCTGNATVALVHTVPWPGFYMTAQKMTVLALGSMHPAYLDDKDKIELEKIFQKCPKGSERKARN